MKKYLIYYSIALVMIGTLYWFVIRKMNLMKKFNKNIPKLLKHFKPSIVKNMERIYRLETNHFKSGQFIGTFSPGMEAFGNSYPWGWHTMHSILWGKNKHLAPIGVKTFTENKTGIKKRFLEFPTLYAAMFTVCTFLEYYGNNPGRWYSKNETSQAKYNKSINSINASISEKYA